MLLVLALIILLPARLLGETDVDRDSLHRRSVEYLSQALAVKSDFLTQGELARKAAQGFELLEQDSLLFEARYLAARAAHSVKDSSAFVYMLCGVRPSSMAFRAKAIRTLPNR